VFIGGGEEVVNLPARLTFVRQLVGKDVNDDRRMPDVSLKLILVRLEAARPVDGQTLSLGLVLIGESSLRGFLFLR
jgi:hypothetical protein